MELLYPQFLFALAVLIIPILIHLFHFRKVKKIYFSNTAFLHQVKNQQKNRQRLKHLLVLACRLFSLAFLVFTFAQPYIPASKKTLQESFVNVYLDNSLSTSNKINENETVLDAGIQYIQSLLGSYPEGTQFRLLTNDFSPSSIRYHSKKNIQELLTEINYSSSSRSLHEISNRLSRSNRAPVSYFVSDFQKSTSGNLEWLENEKENSVKLIPLTSKKQSNIFVDTLFLSAPHLTRQEKNKLHVRLRNAGAKDKAEIPVKLVINGRQIANASLDLPSGKTGELLFDLPAGLSKINRGKLSFQDFPVSYDNEYFFTLKQADPVRILEIRSTANTSPLEQVYGNREMFAFRKAQTQNMDYSQFKWAEFIVINEVNDIDQALSSAIRSYLAQGNGLLFIPSPAFSESNSNSSLFPPLLISRDSLLAEFQQPDWNDPFFYNIFENTEEQFALPKARPLIRPQFGVQSKLVLKNASPFLFESPHYTNFHLLASPLQDLYTDFHNHALFVPVMYKLASLHRNTLQKKIAYTLDDPNAVVNAEALEADQVLKLRKEMQEFIPSQQKKNKQMLISLPAHRLEKGFYEVAHQGKVLDLIALNHQKRESILEPWNREELRKLASRMPAAELIEAKNNMAFGSLLKEQYQGKTLWQYALFLSLCFLLLEILIIRLIR
ncbi:MAG: BatA domain-containing protein [Cytophagales bacterium]|nr:BatA domain-containing protein [Cytophagales bacterium]